FAQRRGQVTCLANPAIQVNDQVRIYERTTSETYIHYVRGISTSHDLDTGDYTMTLTTNWLGTEDDWIITADSLTGAGNSTDSGPEDDTFRGKFFVSRETMEFLTGKLESPKT